MPSITTAALVSEITGWQEFLDGPARLKTARTAVKAYGRITEQWHLSDGQAAGLLGLAPDDTWNELRRGELTAPLKADLMTRISIAVGIYKGLNTVFAGDMADRWPTLPNTSPVFGGSSPVELMTNGGIPQMLAVRSYVDAMAQGL